MARTASTDKHFAQVAKRLQQKQFFLELFFRTTFTRTITLDGPTSFPASLIFPPPCERRWERGCRRTTAPGFKPFRISLNLHFVFSADTSVQLKAIWTWLSFFCCSLGLTSMLETKTTLLHFSVRCSNCFQLTSHTHLFRAENLPGRSAENSSFAVCYCMCL